MTTSRPTSVDPAAGTGAADPAPSVIRSEEQLKHGAINIANCNDLESWDKPTSVKLKK